MATTQKAVDIARDLAAELALRFPTLTVTSLTYTDGNPYITLDDGTPATGEFHTVIKVRPMAWPLATDVLGNAAQVYCPTVIQFVTELNASGGCIPVATTPASVLPLLGVLLSKNCIVEWYTKVNGAAATIANITGTPIATFKDLFWDFKKAQ